MRKLRTERGCVKIDPRKNSIFISFLIFNSDRHPSLFITLGLDGLMEDLTFRSVDPVEHLTKSNLI